MIKIEQIVLDYIPDPIYELPEEEPLLPDFIFQDRLERVLKRMQANSIDYLFFYADREHYMNFEYMTGFGPRFEEALLLLKRNGKAIIFLGNECFNMYKTSRIPADGILYQALSLPSQDCDDFFKLKDSLLDAGVTSSSHIGVVGWKLMYPDYADAYTYDIPSFLIEILKSIVDKDKIINVTDWFIHPDYGLRVVNTAEEIASFEFAASYASDTVNNIIKNMHTGMTEVEISQNATCGFIATSCHPKVLLGDRNDLGMVSPTTNVAMIGDRCQITSGLKGGLTSRKGFFAYSEDDIPDGAKDYIDKIAIPYFLAASNWYENIGIDVLGGSIYDLVEEILPKEKYGWVLNPGHMLSVEEWISSPISFKSEIKIRSGMCFQMDIIPQAPKPYAAVNCEDGIAIADLALQEEIKSKFPRVYARMMYRKQYMKDCIGINLKDEVLPLSNLCGLFRPFLLNHDKGLKIVR